MLELNSPWVGLLSGVTIAVVYYAFQPSPNLPPGPPPKLISGNVHQLSPVEPWKLYKSRSDAFKSPIVSFRVFSRRIIVLNTIKSTLDVLETRSSIYADRPTLWMIGELVGRKLSVFAMSSKNPRLKTYRKLLHASLNPRATESYLDEIERERNTLVEGLEEKPGEFVSHIRRNAGAVILNIAYGWTVTSNDDYFVNLMEESFALSSAVSRPGRWLVDVFPILRFVPSWFPGASFKRLAKEYSAQMSRVDMIPHGWAKEQIESGNYKHSFSSQHLLPEDGHTITDEEEDTIKWCSAALYAGGADTTVSALTSFILLMMLHPQIQHRAQQEIDTVVGRGRLPTYADQPNLPFVSAVLKEVLRYAPVARIGLPHRSEQDDSYLGYHIPEGATVFGNIWACTRDPEVYSNPETFDPDRFLDPRNEMDPRKIVFGFGRRVCPGAHFAEVSLFMNVSAILATFDILKPEGAGDIDVEYTSGVTSHPKPFECRIVRRTIANTGGADV